MKKTACIVQARTGSTRLPGKVLKPLKGKPMLAHIIERLKQAKLLDYIIIATSYLEQDRPIVESAQKNDVLSFAGSEDDVLLRYAKAAKTVDADTIVRVTGDCPLIDPVTVDNTVAFFKNNDYDYVGAGISTGFPRGLDTEVFSKEALIRANAAAKDAPSREHVTYYMYMHPDEFRIGYYYAPPGMKYPEWRLCVDERDDFRLIEEIYERLYRKDEIINIEEVIKLLKNSPELLKINSNVVQKKV